MTETLLRLKTILLPLLLVAGGLALLPLEASLPPPWPALLPWLPLLLTSLVILVGWHFNSSRSILTALLLLAIEQLLSHTASNSELLLHAALLAAPLNLALLCWYRERGVLTLVGLSRLAWLAAQGVALYWIARHQPGWLEHLLYLHWPITPPLPAPLTQPLALALTLPAIWITGRWLTRGDPLDAQLLVTLGLLAYAVLSEPGRDRHTLVVSLNLLLWLVALFKRSHDMAYRDELTGLPGRRALNEALLKLGRRHTLAMVDVDHFKKFNDTHGHDLGDQVLKRVAAQLRKTRHGQAFRYGGEEFCVLFPGRNLKRSLEPLEGVRQAIEQTPIQVRAPDRPRDAKQGRSRRGQRKGAGRSVTVTVSIGAAEHRPGDPALKRADQALYRAKRQGRNRVCF